MRYGENKMAKRIYLNDDWYFTKDYRDEIKETTYDENDMKKVRLPHTCVETPLHYFDESIYQMVSGYRRHLMVPDTWREKHISLTFEGAAHESTVYLNGTKIGKHHCGYTAFTIDLDGLLLYGQENVLCVRLDSRETLNIPPFGFVVDYMTYGGIYRDVYLEVAEKSYLSDVFVHTGVEAGKASVVASEISGTAELEEFTVRQSLKVSGQTESRMLGEQKVERKSSRESGSPKENFSCRMEFPVPDARLWTLESPVLYELKTELLSGDKVLDETITTFGFRSAEFRTDGFYLNGEKIKIRGLNRHQSYPYVGYAMPESMQRRDARILKEELGVNAVRTSHYPQSHYFLDECDRIGLLVFTEIPGWQYIGDEIWKEQAITNVKDMVTQYRNHTSIILWGVRINESADDDAFYRRTNEAAHKADPYRQTGGVRAHKKSSLLEDVYTYNDFVHDGGKKGCEKKKDVTSDVSKPYLVSEYNGHMYPTKTYDNEEHRVSHAIRHANVLDAVAGEEDIAGSFGWCMFDYNTHKDFGSGDRICYHGVMDMFRNPKLAAAVYACEQENHPVLTISSSMDIGEHPGCNRGTTYLFTNASKVRMYKNDRFIKEYDKSGSPYQNLSHGPIIIDDFIGDAIEKQENFKPAQAAGVKYILNATARYGLSNLPKSVYVTALKLVLFYHMKPSEAVGLYNRYIGDWGGASTSYRFDAVEDGAVVASVKKDAMHEIHLAAEADHTLLTEKQSYDVAAVRIRAEDEHGNVLSLCNDVVTFETEGAIELIGPDLSSLQGGMGGTFVRTTGEEGKGVLIIKMSQAKEQRLFFEIKKQEGERI